MSIYKLTPDIAYDHEQGAFMFYGELFGGLRMVPQHFVSRFEPGEDFFDVVCDTKYHKETLRVPCGNPAGICEQLEVILEEF